MHGCLQFASWVGSKYGLSNDRDGTAAPGPPARYAAWQRPLHSGYVLLQSLLRYSSGENPGSATFVLPLASHGWHTQSPNFQHVGYGPPGTGPIDFHTNLAGTRSRLPHSVKGAQSSIKSEERPKVSRRAPSCCSAATWVSPSP